MGRQMGLVSGEGFTDSDSRNTAILLSSVTSLNLGCRAIFVTWNVLGVFNWSPAVTSKLSFSLLIQNINST